MTIAEALVANYLGDGGIISSEQIGIEANIEWGKLIAQLFKICRGLRNSENWSDVSELHQLPEENEIYDLLQQLIDLIGEINGHQLRREYDMPLLLVSYVITQNKKDERALDQADGSRKRFRIRLERYFARQIIIQQAKTPEMLIDDEIDKNLIRRLKTKRKRDAYRKHLSSGSNSLKNAANTEVSKTRIDFATFVVRANLFRCNKKHTIESLEAVIDIVTPSGIVVQKEVPAGYCKECNTYFILSRDYECLHVYGVLLCQLVDNQAYITGDYSQLNGQNLKAESLLHQCGYNVGSIDNLTDNQRHEILKRVVECKLYTREGLIGFLDWLINRSRHMTNMQNAIEKWNNDRSFVCTLKATNTQKVQIKRLIY